MGPEMERGVFMNPTFAKALIGLFPGSILLLGSGIIFLRRRTTSSLLQVIGASGFVTVGLTHVCEAAHFLPWMKWGLGNSPGHYLDLASALVALTLFPIGYLVHAVAQPPS